MISILFQGKPFKIMVIQVYAPTTNADENKIEQFYEDLQDLLETTPKGKKKKKKDVLFIIGDWKAKVESQDILGVTGKSGLGLQNEAEQRLQSFANEPTDHTKHHLPTTQEMILHTDITRWSIPKSD